MRSRQAIAACSVVCFALSITAVMVWTVHEANREADELAFRPPPTVPGVVARIDVDHETILAYRRLGAEGGVRGGWWAGDGGLHWTLNWGGRNGLPGFEFKSFPKEKLPDASVPFGLRLMECTVTDANLRELAHLKNLILLELDPSTLTDSSLRILREIDLLHAIDLARMDQYSRPKSVEEVKSLDLRGTEVTNVGLKELAGFKNLVKLQLNRATVTDDGIAQIRKSLPNCAISATD